MIAPLTPAAPRKPPQAKSAASDDPEVKARQDALDRQQALFDIEAAEQAEFERERDTLETLVMQQLKNEDAIMKKWIELI